MRLPKRQKCTQSVQSIMVHNEDSIASTNRKSTTTTSSAAIATTSVKLILPTPSRAPKTRKTNDKNVVTLTPLYQRIATVAARLSPIFGTGGFAMFPWKTSILGTVIGLVCAQNTTNSFSAVMYNNLITLEPDRTGLEPDWEKLRSHHPMTLQNALSCGPFYRLKSRIIIKLLNQVKQQFGKTSLDELEDRNVWTDDKVRKLLLSYSGIGVKTTSCILLYRLCRLSFAVDTNILKLSSFFSLQQKD